MGAVLYLSLILLAYCLSRAAAAHWHGDPNCLDPKSVPDSVYRAAHRAARGIIVTRVRVSLLGKNSLRYQVDGLLPDGRAVELDVHGDGAVYRHEQPGAAPNLPAAVSRRLRQSLPSFRPRAGAVRLVSGESAVWYEIDGLVSGNRPASLRISPDGKAFHMTVPDRPA